MPIVSGTTAYPGPGDAAHSRPHLSTRDLEGGSPDSSNQARVNTLEPPVLSRLFASYMVEARDAKPS